MPGVTTPGGLVPPGVGFVPADRSALRATGVITR